MRLRRSGSCLLLIGALVVAAGCRSTDLVSDAPDATLPEAFPNHAAAVIMQAVVAEAQQLVAFESQSRIKVERPGQRATLTARLRQSQDSLYGSLSGPFGIRVGKGLVTPDSFFVAYTFGGTFYTGPLDAVTRFVPVPPTSGDLFASLTGTVAPIDAADWQISSDSAHYLLRGSLETPSGPVRQLLRVDPALWRVVEAIDYGPAGEIIGVRTFSSFDQVDDLVIPRRVVLQAPSEEATVVIEHVKMTVNPPALSFPSLSPGRLDVERVE
ncbi:MAG: DUF4292 domain-containing protein [Bacteroidota bacterium]